jgi:GT2 family glycosyltransferase
MSTPHFSVVIPTFNRAAVLPVAIRSVLAQSDRDFELIVLDDGSTDETAVVVASFGDARIRYQWQPNSGVSAARNAGASTARGEFLVFLDSDDELLGHALQRFRAATDGDPDVIFSGWIAVSADRSIWRTSLTRAADDPRPAPWLPGAFAIRGTVFADAGGYDNQLRFAENTELGWRVRKIVADRKHITSKIDEPLVVRYSPVDRPYDVARYEAARRILDRHADALRATPKRRSIYLAIAGVSAARLGKRRASLALATAAVRDHPTSLARYGNLLGVGRAAVTRAPRATTPTPEPRVPRTPESRPGRADALASNEPKDRERSSGAVHGIIVTFGRPESLARIVGELVTAGVDSLTVVDNAPSSASCRAANSAAQQLAPTYVAMTENSGPAGGYAVGMARVLELADDDDWILLLDDDRLTGSDGSVRELRDYGRWLLDHGAPVGAVGLVGARFDRRFGRLHRPKNEELAGPITVDFVAGGQLLMIRVAAARKVGVFDADLFFGFDDLDYCLRLHRHGFGVYAFGPAWLEARRRFERLEPSVGSAARRESAWRRYYGVRNHIVIMRRYTSWSRATLVTAMHLFGRPISDQVRRRDDWAALTRASARGCLDAWTGHLGRRMEPSQDQAAQP